MDSLLHCRCRHSIIAHSSDGCSTLRCACTLSKDTILEAELATARREHQEMYRLYAEPERREG